jgi:hypothetical protein
LATSTLLQPPIRTCSGIEGREECKGSDRPRDAIAVTFNGSGRVISASSIAKPNLQRIDIGSIEICRLLPDVVVMDIATPQSNGTGLQ